MPALTGVENPHHAAHLARAHAHVHRAQVDHSPPLLSHPHQEGVIHAHAHHFAQRAQRACTHAALVSLHHQVEEKLHHRMHMHPLDLSSRQARQVYPLRA